LVVVPIKYRILFVKECLSFLGTTTTSLEYNLQKVSPINPVPPNTDIFIVLDLLTYYKPHRVSVCLKWTVLKVYQSALIAVSAS
jgi:hypothetical protein